MARSPIPFIYTLLLALLPLATAENQLTSSSLNTCQEDSLFSATHFDVSFTPSNGSLQWTIDGVSNIKTNVTLNLAVVAYGLNVYTTSIDPCTTEELRGLCPMQLGSIEMTSNAVFDPETLEAVPGIVYTVPDLDAKVQVSFNSTETGEGLACVEADLSNGKTVDQKGVAWVLAVTSGIALVSSAVTSGLGHSNTAAHVAANALSLFSYFQAQAFIGMTAVDLPPIVASWTQNFQWSMGIIDVDFIQNIATWYQRSTGGTPSQILSDLGQTSVQVQKRSLDAVSELGKRAAQLITRQSTENQAGNGETAAVIIRGIKRVGFRAHIESTNIFLTGYIFFMVFVASVMLGVVLFKFICEGLVKAGRLKHDQFQDFRNGWTTVLRGIMYRCVLIGFPQMVVLCLWEFTQNDSGAEIVLAIFTLATMIGILAWASSKVIRLARRSIAMHKNPAYILYSDPVSLNKWGFLYVQFKATAYFFIVPVLIYVLIKGMFIALGQSSGVAQAVGLVIIEAVFLIGVCILTPYMDKKTNAFNISICVINFVSAIFLLVFSNVFNQPGIVSGVMGVIFFVYNAVFSTVLLIIVLVASVIALTAKNPDTRYQPMRDDRSSFIKSQSQLGTTELDALGATARGESKHGFHNNKGARIEDDDESSSFSDSNKPQAYNQPPASPGYQHDNNSGRHMPPYQSQQPPTAYDHSRNGSMRSQGGFRAQGASPSPWQRGAGYD
ncbi:putative flavin carrier protein 3 [Vermiconidia calcicola]|uniref:Flavin carrier protein 3 n=1 Tax=Vermiconidia calcicola TaxID=1690605 RepID=A0ACC3MA84_9PEZI|nr:putative flavin carrier protein 3 [Vermiconidia calcicola]